MSRATPNVGRNVLHVLGSADWDGTATARIVELLARTVSPERYLFHACFLGTPGPLVEMLRQHCASAELLPNRGGIWRISDFGHWAQYCRRIGVAIVHQHFGGRFVSLAARVARAHVVLHLHGYMNEHDWRPTSPRVLPGLDAVIANSRATANVICGHDLRIIYPAVAALPDRSPGAAPGRLVIGTAARLVPVKGLNVAIDAIARLIHSGHDVELQIAGTGPVQSQLERAAISAGISNRVHFLGWVRNLPSIMQHWAVFVLPSFEEGFGIAILDAMAAGLPVIASNVGGITEVVVDGVTGRLVPPGTAAALERALIDLLGDAQLRFVMGAAGQRRAREMFSPSRMATEICSLYDEIA